MASRGLSLGPFVAPHLRASGTKAPVDTHTVEISCRKGQGLMTFRAGVRQ